MTKVTTYIESELIFLPKPMSINFLDLTGHRFERLLVLGYAGSLKTKGGGSTWFCKCDCGVIKRIATSRLRNGDTKSCTCLRRDVMSKIKTIHGHNTNSGTTKTYRTWAGMINRCANSNSEDFHNYGGRGIKVCERWQSFENFLADMGEPPTPKHSIDRIENDGNYEPSNCRWATRLEQSNNVRYNVKLTLGDRTQNMKQWANELGIKNETIWARHRKLKWSDEKTLTTPVRGIKFASELKSP